MARSKTARNEGFKLVAATANTIGLAVLGLAVLTPVLAGDTGVPIQRIVLGLVFLVLMHLLAHLFLRYLED